MHMSFEDQVRERAYHIWLAGGMADGLAHEHWAMAEQAVKATKPVVILTKSAKPAAKRTIKAAPKSVVAKKTTAKPAARKVAKAEANAAH